VGGGGALRPRWLNAAGHLPAHGQARVPGPSGGGDRQAGLHHPGRHARVHALLQAVRQAVRAVEGEGAGTYPAGSRGKKEVGQKSWEHEGGKPEGLRAAAES